MKFAKRIAVVAIAAVLVTGNGFDFSGLSASAQEISESHLAAAERAVSASRSTNSLDLILPQVADELKAELIRNSPNAEAQISLIVDESAIALAGRRGDLENEAAQIFARTFTEDELNAVADFYESDAGKKFLQESPIVLREIQRAARVWSNGIRRDLAQSVEKKFEEAGLK